ncbi:hypothetical protein niasHT_032971 [Heterodera trifolii]|uniref:PLOD1-3-like GT domain-containing protein n=1 Tax=Heterodera trifolii TaxID=157864 RepID=A0ABD2HV47_9BILA
MIRFTMAKFFVLSLLVVVPSLFVINCLAQDNDFELRIVTVATENTDGLCRLNRSANAFGHQLFVVGMGEPWNGGDMREQGGAQKIRLFREYLEPFKDREDLILLFIDAYDVILNADSDTILRKYLSFFPENRIVFGAEPFCWPDRTLAPQYPPVVFGERYLNSGMFIGFAREIYALLAIAGDLNLQDGDDDQLFYTRVFLDPDRRTKLGVALDSMSYIFQNLNGMQEFVGISPQSAKNSDDFVMLENFLYNTNPLILHGNGPSKSQLNVLENYLTHGKIYQVFFTGLCLFILAPLKKY